MYAVFIGTPVLTDQLGQMVNRLLEHVNQSTAVGDPAVNGVVCADTANPKDRLFGLSP
jgi:hypothetical protein